MAVIQPSRLLNRKNILLLADLIKSLLHLQYISLSSQTNFQLYLTTKILWMKGCRQNAIPVTLQEKIRELIQLFSKFFEISKHDNIKIKFVSQNIFI